MAAKPKETNFMNMAKDYMQAHQCSQIDALNAMTLQSPVAHRAFLKSISRGPASYYALLSGYEWVSNFLKLQEVKKELAGLYRLKREIKKHGFSKLVFLELADNQTKARNEICELEKSGHAMSQKALSAQLDKLDMKIVGLKADVVTLSPFFFFLFIGGAPVDIRQAFVNHWKKTQGRFDMPINPKGEDLSQSGPEEAHAWEILGIKAILNKDGEGPAKQDRRKSRIK